MSNLTTVSKGIIMEELTSIQSYTIRAKEILKRTAQDVIELSRIAHDVHEQYGYQRYIEWVKDDLGLSETFGRNALNVFNKFGSTAKFAVDIAPSALYLLSAPSTPEPVRQEAIKKAENGEQITHKLTKELKEKHKKELENKEKELSKQFEKEIKEKKTALSKIQEKQTENEKKIKELEKQIKEEKKKKIKTVEPDDYRGLIESVSKLEGEKTVLENDRIEISKTAKQIEKEKTDIQENYIKLSEKLDKKEKELKQIKEKPKFNFEKIAKTSIKLSTDLHNLSVNIESLSLGKSDREYLQIIRKQLPTFIDCAIKFNIDVVKTYNFFCNKENRINENIDIGQSIKRGNTENNYGDIIDIKPN